MRHRRFGNSVLAGSSRPEQIPDNIKAVWNTVFTAAELALIDEISPNP